MLLTRFFTALLLLTVTAVIILLDNIFITKSFILLIHLLVLWEWLTLLKNNFFLKFLPVSIFFLFAISVRDNFQFNLFVDSIIFFASFFWVFFVPVIIYRRKNLNPNFSSPLALTLVLSSYFSFNFALERGLIFLFSILFIVWVADSSAYFAGRFFGKTKLAPNISPKKTWEGVIGALISTFFLSIFFLYFEIGWFDSISTKYNHFVVLLLVTVTIFISVVGDLYQSLIKREAKVKDSGFLLPGHGGFFDRFDAMLAVCPFLVSSVKIMQ